VRTFYPGGDGDGGVVAAREAVEAIEMLRAQPVGHDSAMASHQATFWSLDFALRCALRGAELLKRHRVGRPVFSAATSTESTAMRWVLTSRASAQAPLGARVVGRWHEKQLTVVVLAGAPVRIDGLKQVVTPR
jgi:hypothetical protein